MREFICHKKVKAAKIVGIDGNAVQRQHDTVTVIVDDETETIVKCPIEMFGRYVPKPGDYLVEYPAFKDRPAYLSFSPGDVFEDGYRHLMFADGAPAGPNEISFHDTDRSKKILTLKPTADGTYDVVLEPGVDWTEAATIFWKAVMQLKPAANS